jgi:hypothetical protein
LCRLTILTRTFLLALLFVKTKPSRNQAVSKAKSKRPPSRAEWLAMRPLRNPQLPTVVYFRRVVVEDFVHHPNL